MRATGFFLLATLALAGCQSGPLTAKPSPEVTGIDPRTVKWEHDTERRLSGPGFAIAPDYSALAIVEGLDLTVFELNSSRVFRFRSDGQGLREVAFSPDGTFLAALEVVGSNPARIFVFLVGDRGDYGTTLYRHPGLTAVCHVEDDALDLRFSEDSKLLTASLSLTSPPVQIAWDAASGQRVGEVSPKHDQQPGLEPLVNYPEQLVRADGMVLDRTEDKRTLFLRGSSPAQTFEQGEGTIYQNFGLINDRAAGGFDDRSFCVWSVESKKLVLRFYSHYKDGALIEVPGGSYVYLDERGYSPQPERAPGKEYDAHPDHIAAVLRPLIESRDGSVDGKDAMSPIVR